MIYCINRIPLTKSRTASYSLRVVFLTANKIRKEKIWHTFIEWYSSHPNIAATPGQEGEVAAYLESTVNAHAKQGWEFYRVDTIGMPAGPADPNIT